MIEVSTSGYPASMSPALGLLLAVGVEGPLVLAVALRTQGGQALATWLLLVVGANLVTYFPFLAAMALLQPRWGETASNVVLEALVSILEGWIYATAGGLRWRRGLVLGVAANALSFGVGVLIWPMG